MAKLIFATCGLILVHTFLTQGGSPAAATWLTAALGVLILVWAGLARA
jgi:hypothetical protein